MYDKHALAIWKRSYFRQISRKKKMSDKKLFVFDWKKKPLHLLWGIDPNQIVPIIWADCPHASNQQPFVAAESKEKLFQLDWDCELIFECAHYRFTDNVIIRIARLIQFADILNHIRCLRNENAISFNTEENLFQ